MLRAHGLRLDPNLTMAIKALMQAEAFATLLYPEGGIVAEGAEMVREMALQAVTADKVVDVVKDQVMMTARELLKRVPSLQEATLGWLDQYQKGRFEVYVDTSGLDIDLWDHEDEIREILNSILKNSSIKLELY